MVSLRSAVKKRRPELTQHKVITAFLELTAKFGVAGATLQQAAKKAKVPFATAHHHFGGEKGDVREATSVFVSRQAQAFIAGWVEKAAAAGENPLRAYWYGSFEWARLYPAYAGFWLYLYHVLSFDPAKRAHHGEVIRLAQSRIQRLIHEAVGQGRYKAGSATPEVCHNIHALLMGSMILAITDGTPEAFATHADIGWSGAERRLAGL